MTKDAAMLLQTSDELYERYVKPLEREYEGRYIAVSNDGKTVIADSLMELADEAVETLGPGSFAFKIGERAVGRWR